MACFTERIEILNIYMIKIPVHLNWYFFRFIILYDLELDSLEWLDVLDCLFRCQTCFVIV